MCVKPNPEQILCRFFEYLTTFVTKTSWFTEHTLVWNQIETEMFSDFVHIKISLSIFEIRLFDLFDLLINNFDLLINHQIKSERLGIWIVDDLNAQIA